MSLENSAPVAEAPASGQETAPANSTQTNEETSRYQGFSSPDAPEPEEANQSVETQEQQPEQEAEQAEAEANESAEETEIQEPDQWEGYEEVEIDGKKLKIPSEAKEYLLRQADYTRKTQEVSNRSKELDAREAQITERQKLSDNEVDAQLALISVGSQLKKFEGINWAQERAKAADDPIAQSQLSVAWQEFQELQSIHAQGVAYLDNAAKQRTETAKQETANRHAATEAWAAKNIKGWGADLHKQIVTWAGENGLDEATLKQAYTPDVYNILNKAFQWDQSLKRQQSAKPNPPIQQTVKPTPSVTAKANAAPSFDPETSSMDDYAKNWAARQKRG